MDKDSVKNLKDNPYFQEFQDYIISEVSKLDSISNMGKLADLHNDIVGQETKVRAVATDILMSILSPFIDFNEKHKPTEEEINKVKAKVGL